MVLMLREVDYGGDNHSSWFQLKRKWFFLNSPPSKGHSNEKKNVVFALVNGKLVKISGKKANTVFITWMRSLGSILMFVLTSKKSLMMIRSKLNQLGWSHSNVFILSLDLNRFEQKFAFFSFTEVKWYFFGSQNIMVFFLFPKHHSSVFFVALYQKPNRISESKLH